METTIKSLLTGLLLLIFHAAIGQERSEYYAVLPFWESPITPFKGACPITAEEAMNLVHLQLDYDRENRVIAARVQLGGHLKDFEGFFGHLYINAPLTKITYEGDKEVHRFYDRFENPIMVMDGVFAKTYEKDERGRNIRLSFRSRTGEIASDTFGVVEYLWEYLPGGGVLELRRDAKGALVPLRADFQFLRTRMHFAPDGYVSLIENIDTAGQLVNGHSGAASFRYFYNPQGRFLRWEVYDKAGEPAIGPSQTAGEQNSFDGCYLSDIAFFDRDGNPALHWSGAEIWHFEWDRFGNTTSLSFLDRNRALMNSSNGYAQIRFKWSEDGRFLLSQAYFDASGSPAVHKNTGYHLMENHRDTLGLIRETLYKGTGGAAVNRTDTGEARRSFRYGDTHASLGYQSFDTAGNLLR